MYDGGVDERLLDKLEKANREIGRLEGRMAGMTYPATATAEVDVSRFFGMDVNTFIDFVDAVQHDRFIDAIKLVRKHFSLSLSEAKHLVERIRRPRA